MTLCLKGLNGEIPSGSGPTQVTHGIAIQEVAIPATSGKSSGVVILDVESPTIVLTKQRTIKPQEVVTKPRYSKANAIHSVGVISCSSQQTRLQLRHKSLPKLHLNNM